VPQVLHAELFERDAADDQRHGLIAGVAADARHDRHQRRQRHGLFDCAPEGVNHARGEKRREEIQRQPGPAIARGLPDWREQVLFLVQARLREQVLL
jgi:hypothetical protein